jgi:hypothetical protein
LALADVKQRISIQRRCTFTIAVASKSLLREVRPVASAFNDNAVSLDPQALSSTNAIEQVTNYLQDRSRRSRHPLLRRSHSAVGERADIFEK